MAITKHFRDRGANITVTAAGEVLFMPGGQVHGWQRRFGNQIKRWTEDNAPTNKRPRWSHYGKPLKQTFISREVKFRQYGPDRFRVYGTVGSSAPHAYYVDQGTGIYNGRGPYQAKILPPWTRQSPSLYEHTWKVPKGSHQAADGGWITDWEEVGTVTVRGQKGQHFFDKGLDRAFLFMLRSGARSNAGRAGLIPRISEAFNHIPHGMENFTGNTPADGAFIQQLQEWRSWRDQAWGEKRILGLGYNKERIKRELAIEREKIIKATGGGTLKDWRAQQERSRERSRRYRDRQRLDRIARAAEQEAKNIGKKPKGGWASVADKKRAALAQFRRQNPNIRVIGETPLGIRVRTAKGIAVIKWSALYRLID